MYCTFFDMSVDLPRKIGFWGGTSIMVGVVIGSGIFYMPYLIAGEIGDPRLILLLWVAGGIFSLCGALTYAELATMYPRSGGIYVFLHEGLGGMTAFIFGWAYFLIAKPYGAAMIAGIFSMYFHDLFGIPGDHRLASCALLVALTVVNVLGVRLGAGVAVFLTGLKVAALLGIVALGAALAPGGLAAASAPKPIVQGLASAMFMVLWTYEGWSDIASVAGEVKDPQRTIPRILVAGTALVVALYVAVNAVYLAVMSPGEMRGSPAFAPEVARRLIGPVGGTLVVAVVVLSTLGASHGGCITGARITFAQARDGLLFRFLGRVHPRFETPDVSLWTQLALSCAAVVFFKKFEDLVRGHMFMMYVFYALSAAAVIVLRVRRPDAPRPYRCWGYPLVPAVFILSTMAMVALSVQSAHREGYLLKLLLWIVVLAAGAPAYWLWRRFAGRDAGRWTSGGEGGKVLS